MNKIISWFQQHPLTNFALIAIYFIAVVLPHKTFGTFLNTKVFKGITRAEYNRFVLYIALSMLLVFTIIFVKNSAQRAFRNRLWLYMGFNVILATLVINLLFVINIEMIHFPQYAFFAILCFPLVSNYLQALTWATLAGAIDEAYQYFYLAPNDTSYYDFNDVVTNLVGAVFGLLFLRSFGIAESKRPKFLRSSAFYGIIALFLIVFISCLTGILSIYPDEETTYQLLRKWPEGFWSHARPNITYHVMRPLEGLAITGLLIILFSGIGKSEYPKSI